MKRRLSPTERAVLRALLRGQGLEVPHEQLLAAMSATCRSPDGPTRAGLAVVISRLRKKLGAVQIHAAYGVGYRLERRRRGGGTVVCPYCVQPLPKSENVL